MNFQSYIILGIVIVLFLAVVIKGIKNKKAGKSSCSCGGNCGSCGMDCHKKIIK